MKIVFAPYGSRGDVSPAIVLATVLQKRGHEVLLCAPPEARELSERFGCKFESLGSSVREFSKIIPEPALHVWRATAQVTSFLKREFKIQLQQQLDFFQEADLIFGASLNFPAATAAEKNGAVYRFLAYCPLLFPSREYPPVIFRSQQLPAWCNRIGWSMNHAMWNQLLLPLVNQERANLRLQPIQDFEAYWLGSHVLLACDSLLGPVPADVNIRYTQTGAILLSGQKETRNTGTSSHANRVYIGFGSMKHEDPESTTRIAVQAAHLSGFHAIVSAGWAELGANIDCPDCSTVGDISHADLFRTVAAVIHHGGSGTTATAARAGVPQIIVPHITDQFYWADRIQRLGLGPAAPWRSRMTAENLARAIQECMTNGFAKKTKQVADELLRTDSVSAAVELIESAEFLRDKSVK